MKRIIGVPIVFGSDSVNLGGFIETIDPAAVERTLRGDDDVVLLKNHNSDYPLARRSARSLLLKKDPGGLAIDAMVDEEVSFVGDLLRMIQRRDANGGSFAFRAIEDEWSLRNNVPYRRVLDMSISELSVGVAFPAYPATTLHVQERGQPIEQPRRSRQFYETKLRLAR